MKTYSPSTPSSIDPATVLYAHDGTIVTFRWLYADGIRYSVADLHGVTRSATPARGGVLTALAVAGLAVATAVGFASAGDTQSALFAAPFAAGALATALVLSARGQRTEYSLWAYHRDNNVLLFSTRDARRFGQVARAVQRALESVPRELP